MQTGMIRNLLGELNREMGCLLLIDQQAAKVALWSVHTGRIEQGVVSLSKRGILLDEASIQNVAYMYRSMWQIDVSRETRSNCFLCRRLLPQQEEDLCKCFREAHVAQHYGPLDKDGIESLRRVYPYGWRKEVVETIQCADCGIHQEIEAGVVYSVVQTGSPWRSRKFCQNCHVAKASTRPANRPSRTPPQRRASAPVSQKLNLEDVKRKVAAESSTVAEG